jgi:hypothetical protein
MSRDFHTALLREKFMLRDADGGTNPPVIALSNRMSLTLTSENGKETESFIIRCHNMHSCVRIAAAIAKEFDERGAIMGRMTEFKWDYLWKDVIKGYERDWNPDIWGAIYFRGKKLYESGQHHAFLDIIEQCDAHNKEGDYEESLAFAENAFQKAGKAVKIDHDANIALVVKIKDDGEEEREARCGVILRTAGKTTTFNYTVTPKKKDGEMVAIATLLTVSAAFLEGVQLAFTVGLLNKKREIGLIVKYSEEDRKSDKSTSRLINLNTAISRFEQKFTMIYRPERPHFAEMVNDAESKALKILKPLIDEKIAAGEFKEEEWI